MNSGAVVTDHVALVHSYEPGHYGATCVACHFSVDTIAWRDAGGAPHRLSRGLVEHYARLHGDDPSFMGTHEEIEADCSCVWCGS